MRWGYQAGLDRLIREGYAVEFGNLFHRRPERGTGLDNQKGIGSTGRRRDYGDFERGFIRAETIA